jgi:hypothetical protein
MEWEILMDVSFFIVFAINWFPGFMYVPTFLALACWHLNDTSLLYLGLGVLSKHTFIFIGFLSQILANWKFGPDPNLTGGNII